MAQKFVTPITIKNLASSGSDALTVFLNGEAYGRVKLEAGGRISWSNGEGGYDTNIYRDSANVLATDDVLKATAGIITMAVAGAPTAALADGALAVDTTNNTFYFRANGAWSEISGNSTITVSDTAPADAEVGSLWFDSTSLEMFIYYGSAWVQLNADTGAEELSDLFDVEFTNLTANQILKYNGETWVNGNGSSTTVSDTAPATPESGDLWYDSTSLILFIYYSGNWVELTPDIQVEELSDLFDIEFSNLTTNQILKYDGEKWINGNGSSTTVSDTAPASAESGDLWYDSTTLGLFIYYSGNWIELNAEIGVEELVDLFDIQFSNLVAGQVLKYDGDKWINGTGSSTSVGASAPASAEEGDLWYDSATLALFIYYSGNWVEVNSDTGAEDLSDLTDVNFTGLTTGQVLKYNGTEWVNAADNAGATISSIDDITDVTITSAANGQFLKWNGTAWVNDAIDLGTDTTGNYMSAVTAGTGISVTHTPSEGSSAAIGLNATLDNLSDVTITSVSNGQVLKWNGSAWANAADNAGTTISSIDDITDVTITSASNGQFLKWNGTAWVNDAIDLATDTTGSFVQSLVAGTGVTLTNNSGENATPTVTVDTSVIQARVTNVTDTEIGYLDGVTSAIQTQIDTKAPIASPTFTGTVTIPTGASITTPTGLVKGDVGLGSVDNTADTAKPVSTAQQTALDLKANLASPTFTGIVTVPTPSNNTDAATKAYVDSTASSAAALTLDNLTDTTITSAASGQFLKWNGSAWVNDAIDLGTDTTGNFVASLIAGTGVTLTNNSGEGATPTVAIGQAVATNSNVTFNDLTVSGNLTVSGTTTSINTETLTIDDNIIVLNNNATGAPVNGQHAGIEIERGSSTNVELRWNETTDKWQFTNDGSTYSDLGAGGASISSNAPSSPVSGQIWFNQDTAQTFIYYGSVWIEVGAVSNGARVEVSASAPASPATGDLWFDSDTAQTFTYYDSQWIEIGASGMAASIGDTAPTSPVSGQIWFDSTNASTNVYYDSQWVEVGGTTEVFNFVDAKGDLVVGTADNTVDNLAVGTNNQVLTVDSTTATGLKWSTPTVYQAVVSGVSDTEIGYLDGVSSAIQTQLDTKASTGKAIAMSFIFGGG